MKKKTQNVPFRIFKPLIGPARLFSFLSIAAGVLFLSASLFLLTCLFVSIYAPDVAKPDTDWFILASVAILLAAIATVYRMLVVNRLSQEMMDWQLRRIRQLGPIAWSGTVYLQLESNDGNVVQATCNRFPAGLVEPVHRLMTYLGYSLAYDNRNLSRWD